MSSVPDGRRARSERSRAAIVDAFLGLLPEATRRPTVEEIATAANVSERSVYRHFPDVDSLIESAISRRIELMAPLAVVEVDRDAPFEVRVSTFVERRGGFYEASLPLRRFTDRVRDEIPAIEEIEEIRRVFLRDQMLEVFATELSTQSAEDRERLGRTLEAVSSWSTWRHLRTDQGCSTDEAFESMELAVRALLASHQRTT
ncbi:MAG TPA: TetR/AcrR family transcriptional regulator [Microthrixaceae bacterium]|nr:TetR/AcrR family transcriptional regulator [Microthrixaceae bacterium]